MQLLEIKTDTVNLTEEQFFHLCARNKELRIERDKHQNIIIMAPTGYDTGNFNLEIGAEVSFWNRKTKLGTCLDSSAGFILNNKAMRSPDVAWVSKEKHEQLSPEDRKRFAHICPDFVIELVSESDSLKEVMVKMEEWIENGCRLGWLIDPESRMTYIYKPNMKTTQVPFSEMLSGETVLPGFELMLNKIILQ